MRNPGRTAATAAALMIGLALVTFVAIFAAGLKGSIDDAIDKTFSGDLILANTDGFSPTPGRRREAVAEVDGVEVVCRLRFTPGRGPTATATSGCVTAVDPATATDVLDARLGGGLAGDAARACGPTDAVVDKGLAEDEGSASATSSTCTRRGRGRSTYTVAGDVQGRAPTSSATTRPRRQRRARYGESKNATNVLRQRSTDGADASAVQAEIDDGARRPASRRPRSQNQQELKDSIRPSRSTSCSG